MLVIPKIFRISVFGDINLQMLLNLVQIFKTLNDRNKALVLT